VTTAIEDLALPASSISEEKPDCATFDFVALANVPAKPAEIIRLYQLLLGRDPENSFVVEEATSQLLCNIIQSFLNSSEFAEFVRLPLRTGAPLRHDMMAPAPQSAHCAWFASLLAASPTRKMAVASSSTWHQFLSNLVETPFFIDFQNDVSADLVNSAPVQAEFDIPDIEHPDSLGLVHIDSPLPTARLAPGIPLIGTGWVIAETEVREIAIYLNDRFLCYATYGDPRPEVAERFPHFVQADACGFSFNVRLGSDIPLADTAWIFVRVAAADGSNHKKGVPVSIVPAAELSAATVAKSAAPGFGPVKISVESARIDGNGTLRVSGWALSLFPLRSLELFLGDAPLGMPEMGISRPDVATSYADYPEAAAAGFRLIQDVAHISAQHSVLRVRATAVGGVTRQVIVPVTFPEERRHVASDEGGIHLCVDSVAVRSDGSVLVAGWAVAAAGIQSINVDLDAQSIGVADVGGDRPDVGNRFPRIPSARRSGFSYTCQLDLQLHGEHVLTLRVTDSLSKIRLLQIPVLIEEVTAPDSVGTHVENVDDFRFDIDSPVVQGDRAREPIIGVLNISGWALSSDGIENISIFLDDQSLGTAYYGMRREDIAAVFPHIEGCLLSGFALMVPHRMLGEGERNLRVLFKSKGGKVAERAFTITVMESEETISSTQLRHRLTHVEQDLFSASVDVALRPVFVILVKSAGDGETERRHLRQTLESISRQAFDGWRVAVVPAPAESATDLDRFVADNGGERPGRARLGVYGPDMQPEPYEALPAGAPVVVASLRAGDLFGADALLRAASDIASDEQADFWYTDERRIDPATGLEAAFFKPDWSPELLTSSNYIGRSWFAAHDLVRSVGLDMRMLAQVPDYDAVLRLTEGARGIGHIRHVLLDTTKADTAASEPDAEALKAALGRRNADAEIAPGRAPATWQIKRRLKTRGKVSFVIPTCAARGLIRTCVESIRGLTTYKNYELVVIDNIPDELETERKWVKDNCDRVLKIPDKFNWSRFNNIGANNCDGEFLLFLNDDMQVLDGTWLETLLAEAERPEIGVVGPQLLYPDGKVQHAGIFLAGAHGRHAFRFSQGDDPGYFGLALTARNMIAVTGACMLSRRDAYDRVGGFDEAHSVVNNDLDYCLRMWRSGQRVLYTPFASLIHHELASRAAISDIYDEDRFVGEWSGVFLKGDPYFNPNLSAESDDYAAETEPAEIVHAAHPLLRATSVRSILALKLDHIGDFITALPALRRLKARFPDAKLSVLASKASKALAGMEPAIDEVIAFDFFHARSGLGRREIAEEELDDLRQQLRGRNFDIAVDLRMQPDTRPMLQYTGARLLAGFDHAGRFPWLDVMLEWEGDTRFAPKRMHVVDRLHQLVEAVAIACDTDRSGVPVVDRAEAWARVRAIPAIAALPAGFLDKPLVCVHPAVGSDTRQWPEEHFAGLIDLLVADQGVHVALIGSKEEIAVSDKVLAAVQHRSSVVSLLGALSLRELPLLLQVAVLYVGNNSGPKHLAAALGTPTVGVHSGVVDATEWGPFGPKAVAIRRKTVCSPCYLAAASDCHRQLACLRKLRPSDVVDICRTMLAVGKQSTITPCL
jgi:ADP-heptose:LPS heptosyltransferase/GT2 family glycosyltransferase